MNGLNATARPIPAAPFNHPSLTRDEQRVLAANLSDTFPEGIAVKWERGGECVARFTVDGKQHEERARSIPQLLTYIHDFNLARRTRAA